MKFTPLVPSLVAILVVCGFMSPVRAQVVAVPANEFLNSLGINTHIGQGIAESSYEPLFTYTGIRNDRDKLNSDTSSLVALHTDTVSSTYPGVMCDIHDNWTTSGMTTAGDTLAAAGALLSFEGPNEPNTTTFTYNGLTGGGHAFPSGITVSATTGTLSGTNGAATGAYTLALTAVNSTGTGRATLTYIVNPVSGVPVITSAAAAAASNSAFTYNIVASNSPTSYNAANLPAGLLVNTTTGAISGTPTPASGTYTVALTATNAAGTGSAILTIVINAAAGTPVITSPASATTTTSGAFSYSITATGSPTSYTALSSWVPVAQYMRDLYTAIGADSNIKNYPIFGVSEDGDEWDNVGLQFLTIPTGSGCLFPDGSNFFDFGNCHNYVDNGASYTDNRCWLAADPSLSQGFDGMYGEYTGTTWNKHFTAYPTTDTTIPKVTTETGWGTTGTGSITQAEQANIFLDVYLSQFKRGWTATFIYEMRDGEGGDTTGEGIYTSSSTPKTSATDIHNLTTILQDTVSGTPGTMNYTIPSEPSTVHDLLLQKSNGTFYLVVWDEKFSTTGNDNVTVDLGATATTVQEYDPTVGTAVQTTLSGVNSVALTLKDHPIILAISGLESTLPSPWANEDIGAVGVTGTSTYSTGTFTVTGSGTTIGGRADSFQYCYQPVSGNCTITALCDSETFTHHAQAGVMIRETLSDDATFAYSYLVPELGVYYETRTTTGGAATDGEGLSGPAAPYWLRVQRSGNVFTESYSSNGTAWTTASTSTITMASSFYVGLAHCSVVNTLGTSTYSSVSVTSP